MFGNTAGPTGNRPDRQIRQELEFLPAALEIVETPPSPTAQVFGASIILLFCSVLAWVCVGKVDIIATAPGKIIPSERSKNIQPFETGVVRAIYVTDGQAVKAGDLLIQLDSTINGANRNHMLKELQAAELDVARLRAAVTEAADPATNFHPPGGSDTGQVDLQLKYLDSQLAEQKAKLANLDSQESQKDAEVATTKAAINKLTVTIPILRDQVNILLSVKDFSSKLTYLERLQRLTETQEDLKIQQSRLHEIEAAAAAIVAERTHAVEEFRRTLYADLAEAERKAGGFREDLARAQELTRLSDLRSPVDGVVQQLAIHTVGGVVTPAQSLMVVVPADSQLEIEATISNHDIGFVRQDQPAEIKVVTFNFARYGLLHGRVQSISSDAIPEPRSQDVSRIASGDAQRSGEGVGQELSYAARVSLDQTQMQIDDRLVRVSPGMAVTVEINTGSRTLISYLLSPLLRFEHDSLRER